MKPKLVNFKMKKKTDMRVVGKEFVADMRDMANNSIPAFGQNRMNQKLFEKITEDLTGKISDSFYHTSSYSAAVGWMQELKPDIIN